MFATGSPSAPRQAPGSGSRSGGRYSPLADPLRGLRRLALAAATALAGCGGGATAPYPAANEVEWVRAVMEDRYLYAERMPAADLSGLTGAAQALEALRVDPPDRFSFVDSRSRYDGFFDEGRALGLGIGFRLLADAVVLRFVHPDSPAGRAGLARGDRILAIDGIATAELIARDSLQQALGPNEPGVTLLLAVERGTERREVTVTKDWYTVSPILAQRVIERAGRRIGYVALYAFTEPARNAWADSLESLRAEGVREIVVDLRDNGGGRLFVAAEVAGSLAPRTALGQTFTQLLHNARRADDDLTIPVPAHPATGAFDQVAWIVSEASCSASEVLIAGLRPFRGDALIGTPTCGKPVGFEPQVRGDQVLSAVTFAVRNRDGLGDWFAGLAPTCLVSAEPHLAYGDESDPRLAQALHWLDNRACSAPVAAATATPKARAASRTVARGLSSLTGLH